MTADKILSDKLRRGSRNVLFCESCDYGFLVPDNEISDWLTKTLVSLNKTYISKLISKKATSNIMLILRND